MAPAPRKPSVQPAFRKEGPEEVGYDEDAFHPSAVSQPSACAGCSVSVDGTLTLISFVVGWLWLMQDLTGYDLKMAF